jgi:hypothetical protein
VEVYGDYVLEVYCEQWLNSWVVMLYVLIASFYALCFIIFVRRNSSSSFSFSIFFEKNNKMFYRPSQGTVVVVQRLVVPLYRQACTVLLMTRMTFMTCISWRRRVKYYEKKQNLVAIIWTRDIRVMIIRDGITFPLHVTEYSPDERVCILISSGMLKGYDQTEIRNKNTKY